MGLRKIAMGGEEREGFQRFSVRRFLTKIIEGNGKE